MTVFSGRKAQGEAMRIVVDRNLCESNGICVQLAPDMFVIDDDDKMRLLVQQPAPDQIEKARAAVRKCPRSALSLVEAG
jgi:ferredoxin